ncbi:hypothetical protein PYW08_010554 [Mythimna loreyi]|uniref:Uncharacterized protein n=1 Tax=Mythimna loreyi TaxID=667449 RepID=A0ACC2Q6R9_9NEOP|nr:hypothetical protein PYW08_010554 [Mythimna loreyi]
MHTLRFLRAAHNESVWLRRKKRNIYRKKMESVENMPELLFTANFRLNKNIFRQLCNDLRVHTSLRGSKEIPLAIKVLTALSFLATGSYQRIVGVSQQLTQRTTSRCIRQVVDALNHPTLMTKWIKFPQSIQERSSIKEQFQRKYHLPGVIGCIDCTHIAIVKPAEEEHTFYNRKGYHSLNVQMVCDHNLKIINVNAKFGGATHDSHIWSSSLLEPYMRRLHESGEHVWLLGDSGYPQRPWLMTPILNAPQGSREEVYTTRHVQARTCIERCFGLLKTRWRCLLRDRVLHYHPTVASKIILACCVLHNISLHANLPSPIVIPAAVHDNDDSSTQISNTTQDQNELIRGRAMLNYLISRL